MWHNDVLEEATEFEASPKMSGVSQNASGDVIIR